MNLHWSECAAPPGSSLIPQVPCCAVGLGCEQHRPSKTVDNRWPADANLATALRAVFSDRCLGDAQPRIEDRAELALMDPHAPVGLGGDEEIADSHAAAL